jgi:hypothetical protein
MFDQRGLIMLDRLYEMVEYFKGQELVFWYNGPVSQVLVVEIGDIIKKSIEDESDRKVINRIFAILVEQMQNIIKYSVQKKTCGKGEEQQTLSTGIIAVGAEDDHYSVVSGNIVNNSDMEHIRNRLDIIISMDKDAQKEYYKTMRRQEPDERSRGAGLGFIEMARKSSKPLEYRFTRIDNDLSFFSLKALVKME